MAKQLRISAYNGDYRLADRVPRTGTGKCSATFPATRQGKRDARVWILNFMLIYPPEANRLYPARIRVEETWASGAWSTVGAASGKNGAWIWEKRPEWAPP